ncbi:TPA: helix-turn-helix transcriptional regulator [Citrobacter freundii]|uniref:helix-turn-helix transcriptional regulator n=1 Tax=Citrobacter freundii TaxID=546 RepID=UPI001907EF2A|nr:AlpA family phage regulatory protein [Citrobacter freundii]MBJ8946548.1 AlpA family phage regulatory protein [Citrobacter freundii]
MKPIAIVEESDFEFMPDVDQIIREPVCRKLTTLSNTTRWRLEKEGKFPKRRKLGRNATGYLLSEVQAWIRGEWLVSHS